jgi:hypothetical protein
MRHCARPYNPRLTLSTMTAECEFLLSFDSSKAQGQPLPKPARAESVEHKLRPRALGQ